MFIFSSILIAATWLLSRVLWDRVLRPRWRGDPAYRRRRFIAVTATGLSVAMLGFGGAVSVFYGVVPGLVAAAVLAPVYAFIALVLHVLLEAFGVDIES